MTTDPNEIILARRLPGFGDVSVDFAALQERMPDWTPSEATKVDGMIHAGDTIPMRREEAEGREDFEPVEPKTAHVAADVADVHDRSS